MFERPTISTSAEKPPDSAAPPTPTADGTEATPTAGSEEGGRKHWGGGEGAAPLVAMLQEKTLQTATYSVPNTTQSEYVWVSFEILFNFV